VGLPRLDNPHRPRAPLLARRRGVLDALDGAETGENRRDAKNAEIAKREIGKRDIKAVPAALPRRGRGWGLGPTG
jgi:hypothetical protein